MEHTEQFYIGGKWVDPVSRQHARRWSTRPPRRSSPRSPSVTPTTSTPPSPPPRDAFESYSLTSREERLELFDRIIEGYKQRWAEIGDVIRREMGAPAALAQRAQAGAGYAHFATMRGALADFEFERAGRLDVAGPRADRRVRADHAVELADEPGRVQGRPGARRRLHDGAQAVGGVAAQRHRVRRDPRRGRRARRRVQPGAGRRGHRRRRPGRPPRRRHGVVHRLDPRRHRGGPPRRAHREAGRPGARRQVGQHRARRRRPGGRRGPRRGAHVQQLRAVVQRAVAHARARRAHGRGGGRRGRGGERRSSSAIPPTPRRRSAPWCRPCSTTASST